MAQHVHGNIEMYVFNNNVLEQHVTAQCGWGQGFRLGNRRSVLHMGSAVPCHMYIDTNTCCYRLLHCLLHV